MSSSIIHPLPLETIVEATKPQCPCKGASTVTVIGRIKKVISNQTGHWYYLDIGSTISAQSVIRIR